MSVRRPNRAGLIVVGLLAVGAAAVACDARRGSAPPHPSAASDGAVDGADPYAGLPENLRRALLGTQGTEPEDRLEAIRALARLQDERALPRLIELLDDPEARVRCATADAIGGLGVQGRAAAGVLSARFDADPAAAVRQCALLSLARVGGDEALDRLLTFLEESDPGDLQDAIDALGRLGRIEAVPRLVEHLESPDPSVVAAAERAITRIGPGGAGLVRPYLDSSQPQTRCAAANILARLESADDEARLRRLVRRDGDRTVRICALGALGHLGDSTAVDQLGDMVTATGDDDTKALAAEALGVAATGPAIRTLIRGLTVFHGERGPNAAQAALLAVGPPARSALEEALPTGPPLRRALVAETLGLLGDPAANWSLERAALDTDPTVREAALAALEVLRSRGQADAHRTQR